METTKERAARCDRATHARRSSSLSAYGSRTASITRRRRRAKRKALRAATLAAAVLLLGGISVAIFTAPTGLGHGKEARGVVGTARAIERRIKTFQNLLAASAHQVQIVIHCQSPPLTAKQVVPC